MVSKHVVIGHPRGLYMAPAKRFTDAVTPLESEVTLVYRGRGINGKDLMTLMEAGIDYGDGVELRCTGPDEDRALRMGAPLLSVGPGR